MSWNREQLYEGHINMYPPQHEQGSKDYSTTQLRSEANQPGPYQDDYGSRSGAFTQGSVITQQGDFGDGRVPAAGAHITDHHPGEWMTTPLGTESVISNESPSSTGSEAKKANMSPEKVRHRPFSEFSEEALMFYKVYEATIQDSTKFTPEVQLRWCETLLEYAFKNTFISRYSINAEKLKRDLTPQEMQRNKTTLLEHALKVLAKLIKLKHPPSLYLMGTLYSHQPYLNIEEEGIVPKNDQKALEYYKAAAKLDNADGCYRAGVCYEFGKGVPQGLSRRDSLLRAVQFYERGAMLTKDLIGSTCCMFKLGTFQLNGLLDDQSHSVIVNQDVLSAIQWFERATENDTQSSSQAMFELAKVYEQDMLSPRLRNALRSCQIARDPVKALELYIKCACKCRYPLAQWKLGHCYEFAELNLPYSPEKSMAWYYLAASSNPRGNPMAMIGLSGWYLTGSPNVLAPNDAEAFNWAYRASQASDGRLAKAEYALAVFYEAGIGCTQDLNKALEYHRRAAKLGHKKAAMRLNHATHDGQNIAV